MPKVEGTDRRFSFYWGNATLGTQKSDIKIIFSELINQYADHTLNNFYSNEQEMIDYKHNIELMLMIQKELK